LKNDEEGFVTLNPYIPLYYLFQMSAFPIEYLDKKGRERFQFISGGDKGVGQTLQKAIDED